VPRSPGCGPARRRLARLGVGFGFGLGFGLGFGFGFGGGGGDDKGEDGGVLGLALDVGDVGEWGGGRSRCGTLPDFLFDDRLRCGQAVGMALRIAPMIVGMMPMMMFVGFAGDDP
jgi:hypothetical protein